MKIEKLTENKIRIILKSADLKVEHIDVKAIMTKNTENQDFFFDLLKMAKAEVGFDAEGCKVLIEAFSPSDENVVFTITKYPNIEKKKSTQKLKIKKKSFTYSANQFIYNFNNFDDFCDFCDFLNNSLLAFKKLFKLSSLYLYNDTYYLILKNNVNDLLIKKFITSASEFALPINYSESFVNKLLEHGKCIMKKDAINSGIKYFVN